MYSAVTRDITVSVVPFYLEDRSDPSREPLCLGLSHHHRQPVRRAGEALVALLAHHRRRRPGRGSAAGEGVVGDQPDLDPGDSYQYTSGCPLSTPSGIMVGRYTMRNSSGELFDIDIPAFSLDLPGKPRSVN